MNRRAAKQPEAIFVFVIVLGVYIYVFINDLSSPYYRSGEMYLPAIVGSAAGIIASFFACVKSELPIFLMFGSALLLTGIYQGLSGTPRLVVAILSLMIQSVATIFFINLYIAKKRKKKEKRAKVEEDFAKTYSFLFTVLILLIVLQLTQLIAMLFLPLTLFTATPIWIILLGGGVIIAALIFTLRKHDIPLLLLLAANVIVFAISFLIKGLLYLAVNIILLGFLMGAIFYIVKKFARMFGRNIYLSKTPLVVAAVLLVTFIATYVVLLLK